MYTSQKSIETKVGHVKGWKDLLISVGFRFEPGTNGIPPSVFFPQNDPGERLTQCSASLQAVLGLSQTSWVALSKLLTNPEEADEIIALFRAVTVELNSNEQAELGAQVPVNVKLWRIPGCHELLASLGFDLMEVGKEDVILKTGKTANRRQIQFALQALLALFDTQDAPRCIDVDEDSSSYDDEEDDGAEDDDEMESSEVSPDSTPFPAPRKSSLILDGHCGSAFTSYVRNRGEPDGRQAGLNDSPPASGFPTTSIPPPPIPPIPPLALGPSLAVSNNHTKGHESDCNFTPSPVDPVPKLYGIRPPYGFAGGSPLHQTTPHSHAGPYNYGQQRMKHSSGLSEMGAESSSSASSINDMANVVRRPNMHQHPSIQNKLDQALHELNDMTSNDRKPSHNHHVPLYENSSSVQYSVNQPAGKPVTPIRSVFTDVGYQATQKIQDRSDPNDKFSVRAETRKINNVSATMTGSRKSDQITVVPPPDIRLNPGVTKRVPPTGESSESPDNSNAKRLSLTIGSGSNPNAETASITTISSANTFIVKSDDGIADQPKTDLSEINIQDSIRTSNLRRNPPISEVYHESRNVGLGLAPPLSSLILTNNLQVVQVDHHSDSEGSSKNVSLNNTKTGEESFSNFDNLSEIEHAHKVFKAAPPPSKRRPPIPPKPLAGKETWSPKSMMEQSQQPHGARPVNGLSTRDEGDGRSMTDSQYSGYSPNGLVPVSKPPQITNPKIQTGSSTDTVVGKMNYLKLKDYMNDQEITVIEEGTPTTGRINPKMKTFGSSSPAQAEPAAKPLKPSEIAKFINSEFKMPELGQHQHIKNGLPEVPNVKTKTFGAGDTKHPQLWSRDHNGSLHYTGMFSSDC